MKTNRQISVVLVTALLLLPSPPARAQDSVAPDQSTNSASPGEQTNAIPTLKELMATNNVVTNTADIVLVKISPGLWVGKYEVTQGAYLKVMRVNPSVFRGWQRPVDSVSWYDAVAFCRTLTAMERKAKELPDGYSYTLPTEAQWEMLVGDALLKDAVMSLNGNHRSSTSPVGSLGPNKFGLYDIRGNVWEWCLDSHDPSSYHVLRGGAWDTRLEPNSRTDFRWYVNAHPGVPGEKRNDFGFRVVLKPGSPP
jgi:formylglycine-generating enzyme required for sulfatase activity